MIASTFSSLRLGSRITFLITCYATDMLITICVQKSTFSPLNTQSPIRISCLILGWLSLYRQQERLFQGLYDPSHEARGISPIDQPMIVGE